MRCEAAPDERVDFCDEAIMEFGRRFFHGVAICSIASAVTTLGLIFLPRAIPDPSTFEERMALHAHPVHILHAWVYLVHPFLTLLAAWGVVIKRLRESTAAVTTGFIFFLLWGFTEAGQQAMTIVAYDGWRASYAAADEATREIIRVQVATYDAAWNAMWVIIVMAFILANTLFGIATARGRGIERWISVLYFAAAALSVFLLTDFFGAPLLPAAVLTWSYPLLQPLARTLIGVWLWRGLEHRD